MGALIDLPLSIPVLSGWVAWLATGLAIAVWTRRSRESWSSSAAPVSLAVVAKPRSEARTPKPAPPARDAFEDLQALLDPTAPDDGAADTQPQP